MSSIIDQTRYFSVPRPYRSANTNGNGDLNNSNIRKPFHNTYKVPGIKVFDDKQNRFSNGPLSTDSFGIQIFCSTKNDTVYTGSSVISGYRDDGFLNSFDSMEAACKGKLSKSVNCCCGPFLRGHLINTDVSVKLITLHEMGMAVLSDLNMQPTKKIPYSESGPANDLAISFDEELMVVANRDHSMTLIELNNFSLEDRIHSASHFNPTGVDFSPSDKHLFVTCCKGFKNDRNYVTLWDTRTRKPGIVNVAFSQPSNCIKWSKRDENLISVATIDGFIQFIDIRHPDCEARSMKIDSPNPVIKMKMIGDQLIGFNRSKNLIKIDEISNEFTIIETDLDFNVRDTVEYNDQFYAIGGQSIFPHLIDIRL